MLFLVPGFINDNSTVQFYNFKCTAINTFMDMQKLCYILLSLNYSDLHLRNVCFSYIDIEQWCDCSLYKDSLFKVSFLCTYDKLHLCDNIELLCKLCISV